MAKKKGAAASAPAKPPMIVPYTKPSIKEPKVSSGSDLEAITASLSAEFDTLDTSLILAFLSDYPLSTISAELPNIREQLAILQACSVPDDNDPNVSAAFPTDPSASTSVSDIADLLERAELAARWESEDLPSPIRSPQPPSSWKEGSKKRSRSGSSSASGSASGSSRPSGSGSAQRLVVGAVAGSATGSKAGSQNGSRVESVSGGGSQNGSGSSSAISQSAGWSSSPTTVNEEVGLEDEMGLLHSLFPNLKTGELRTALDDAISLQAAIDQLLSVELIKDVERSGAWPGEQNLTDDEFDETNPKNAIGSSSIPMSPASSSSSRSRPEKRQPKRHYALIDTLQRVPTPSSHSSSRAQSPARLSRTYGLSGPAPNAWHTLASLASQLAELLAPHPEGYFVSYLHSPEYRSAYGAVHAALKELPSVSLPADSAGETILQDLYGLSLTEDGNERKQRDLKAAMRVGGEDVGVVMDLVELLEEISHWPQDEDVLDRYGSEDEEYEIPADTFETLPTPAPPRRTGFTSRTSDLPERITRKPKKVPAGPTGPRFIPGAQPAASSASFPTARDDFGVPSATRHTPSLMPSNRRQVHIQNWRKVEYDRAAPHEPSAGPTYAYSAPATLSVADCLNNAALARHKRETAIRAAGMHFSGHLPGGKAVNASVAGHYASQARTAGDQARSWELRAARMVVGAQLQQTGHTVDLHHLTQAEAVVVAKEVVGDWYEKQRTAWGTGHGREGVFVVGRPMTIITGVGNHSAGKRGVLGPAVAGALEREGWKVERGENARGYLVVKGKR